MPTTLNNNQAASIVNAAIAQSIGSDVVGTLDLQGIVDTGNDPTIIGTVDNFNKALINVMIKNLFTDTEYKGFDDPFYVDSEMFGAFIQAISVEVPEMQASHAWVDYTSGQTVVGQYTVYLPLVESQVFGLSTSVELPLTITDNQWNTAFRSASDLLEFVNYIWLNVRNAIQIYMQTESEMNRNNFIAEKFAYAASDDATGVHTINLVAEYCKKFGVSAMTVDEFRTTPKALLFASQQIKLYKDYIQHASTLFNVAGKKKFVAPERLVVEVLADFESDIEVIGMSNTYHDDIVALPGHRTIAAWQGFTNSAADTSIDFDAVSTIDVETGTDGTKITKSGICAMICDKLAIMFTKVDEYLAHQRFDINRIDHYAYQFCSRKLNNLSMPAIIFYLEDVSATA